MARQVPVKSVHPDVVCTITSEQEILLAEANRIAGVFLQNLEDAYGDEVLPKDSSYAFHFEILVNKCGQIISPLPTLDQISKAKANWLNGIARSLRSRQ